jgi:signal transduction histidine kinase
VLLKETTPSTEQMAFRLQAVERDVVLPVKGVFVGILLYYLHFSRWFDDTSLPRHAVQEFVENFFLFYLVLNFAVALTLIFVRRLPSPVIRSVIFVNSFVDGLFLAALTFVTGGFDSILYWVFLGLIVRNSLSVPLAVPQIILNLSVSFCYLAAGVLDVFIEDQVLDPDLLTSDPANPAEPFLLRLIVLWLMTVCCYGVQVLFEKQRQTEEEAREFTSRQSQLRAAGRLAAQIAHQLKNPLSIINNAAFSLQRAISDGKPAKPKHVEIIREEVEKSDRILTKLMGYAQLSEGRVERLDVRKEMDDAIEEVFPINGPFSTEIKRNYDAHLPHLLMQRHHLSEILVNVLINAREAMGGKGEVRVTVTEKNDQSVVITIQDDGKGIPEDQLARIFNPYHSNKEKGTGLGLAIVKNNVEMYSGRIEAESELGKGACFRITLPTRTFMRIQA